MEYDESKGAGENLFRLSQELKRKKSVRAASFHQGSSEVEEKDSNLRRAKVSTGRVDKIEMPAGMVCAGRLCYAL